MDKIETEQELPLFEPNASDIFSEANKRKIFSHKADMLTFISMSNVVAAQFRKGDMNGVTVFELVYTSEGN